MVVDKRDGQRTPTDHEEKRCANHEMGRSGTRVSLPLTIEKIWTNFVRMAEELLLPFSRFYRISYRPRSESRGNSDKNKVEQSSSPGN